MKKESFSQFLSEKRVIISICAKILRTYLNRALFDDTMKRHLDKASAWQRTPKALSLADGEGVPIYKGGG